MESGWHDPTDGGKEGWREGGWGWEEGAARPWAPGPADTLPRKEKLPEAPSPSTCLCFPLRSGVLAVGLIGSTLALSGLVAYAIVQVPTLRGSLGSYFNHLHPPVAGEPIRPEGSGAAEGSGAQGGAGQAEEHSLWRIAYTSEIVGAVLGATLGLLANLLLVWGVLKGRRWFLVHWLVLHLFMMVLLFVTGILIFVVQLRLWKLLGLAPVVLALVTMYLWTKVYTLFLELRGLGRPPAPCARHPQGPRGPWPESLEPAGPLPGAGQFYPGDPLSRGMADRLRGWNMVCVPYEDQDSPYLGAWEQSSHTYRRASGSSSSSIVPDLATAGPRHTQQEEQSRTDSRVSPAEI